VSTPNKKSAGARSTPQQEQQHQLSATAVAQAGALAAEAKAQARRAEASSAQAVVNAVELDALVVMKIAKHCSENLPDIVTGALLGLDEAGVLRVANCFPFPPAHASIVRHVIFFFFFFFFFFCSRRNKTVTTIQLNNRRKFIQSQ
jgi:hypothetical protein